jgi:hypothetical protein
MQRSVSVPFLPGQVVKPDFGRTNHRKPQTLIYKLDCAVDNLAPVKLNLDPELLKSMSVKAQLGSTKSMTTLPTEKERSNRPDIAIQPAWLKHDKQALRFFAYFQEPVVENPTENFRIRNVVLTFFLEDGTMQITEPKVENSGIWPQGPFVKRHRIPKGDGSFWSPPDLKMGIDITIYARTFHVVSCDEFTKWFYGQAGLDIGVEEETPLDNFFENQVFKKVNMKHMTGLPRDVMRVKSTMNCGWVETGRTSSSSSSWKMTARCCASTRTGMTRRVTAHDSILSCITSSVTIPWRSTITTCAIPADGSARCSSRARSWSSSRR